MLRRLALIGALATAASTASCYVESQPVPYDYYNRYGLANIAPGVAVVMDYEYPVFYAERNFWLYDRGAWYRSAYPYGGWIYAVPPPSVLGIYNPAAYVHYHPYGARYHYHVHYH